jgi:hypothetical protein
VIAAHFWNILEQAEAQNYVELHYMDQMQGRTATMEFNSPDMIEKIVILIQRSLGKTPHQLRREAEERYEALRFGFAAVAQLLIDAVSPEVLDRAAVTKAQVEAMKVGHRAPRGPHDSVRPGSAGEYHGGGGRKW